MSNPENQDNLNEVGNKVPAMLDRRVSPRFTCDRGVQCWKDGNHVAHWGTFVDLGLMGCSIHLLPTPLPVGTHLTLVFTLYGNNIRISGEVRMVHGAVMGVAFASMTEKVQNKLCEAVQRLADGRTTKSEVVLNTQAAVLRLQRWFKNHETLSRETFQRLLDGSFDPALETSAGRMPEIKPLKESFAHR
jgi:hypothetical protein